ncbi:major facilitator superfamily domain-containing protein [Gloeopeniophorella convolvens]|nr:major facilitator superfamily domain-containing protein [Gloeopeniophorella convolvens]
MVSSSREFLFESASYNPDEPGTSDQEAGALLANGDDTVGGPQHIDAADRRIRLRSLGIRALALLCACSLSIGSHYGSYILAPLKSRLSREMGTSNTEFSLLISAFSLNSTWTPLLGGIVASRLGTTLSSILATGIIFSGLSVLLVGDLLEDVRLMTMGMFIFGLGISPLSVVQETIIVRFFKSHGLGISMALGLVAGKASSFVSARTSYPLSERFGPHAPFYAATVLAAFSFGINLVYVSVSRWLVSGSGAELEAPDIQEAARQRLSVQDVTEAQALQQVADKKKVNLHDITELGDVFWAYIGVNILCGAIWHPFSQLASNIFEHRFDLTEREASKQASFLLAGSMVLYPLVGVTLDRAKRRHLILLLFTISSLLTISAYCWLVLPPSATKTAWPAIVCFATGIGYSPLLLVVLVPQLVSSKYISTTLGAHKSLEQTGTVISQTIAGLILDTNPRGNDDTSGDRRYQHLLNTFLGINILQFVGIMLLWHLNRRQNELERRRRKSVDSASNTAKVTDLEEGDSEEEPLLLEQPQSVSYAAGGATLSPHSRDSPPFTHHATGAFASAVQQSSRKRGKVFGGMCLLLIIAAWVLFLVTAWLRLRSKSERGGLQE